MTTMKDSAYLTLLEDNPADVHLVSYALEQVAPSVQLRHFENGNTFIKYLEQHPRFRPNCLLLDLNMPIMDGHQVIAKLRSDPKFDYLPIIVFTSSAKREDLQRAYRLGANAYVRKPLELEELLAALRSIVNFWFHVNLLPRS